MSLLLPRSKIRRQRGYGSGAVKPGIQEDTLRPAIIEWKQAFMTLMALLVISQFTAAVQKPTTPAQAATATDKPSSSPLPTIWHSEASHKDFRVGIKGDMFQADWINIPAAAAKSGASMRIECRRTGTKWVGSASVYQGIAVPGAAAGKDVKMCRLTVRFEVDSITPQKITFHSEAMRNIDAAKCQLLQTAWEEFSWLPKK